jgi:hypothetical protein
MKAKMIWMNWIERRKLSKLVDYLNILKYFSLIKKIIKIKNKNKIKIYN